MSEANLELSNSDNLSGISKNSAAILLKALSKIEFGKIDIQLPDGQQFSFIGRQAGPQVSVKVNKWDMFDAILNKSDIGLGESYIRGEWVADSVASLVELALLNRSSLKQAMFGQWGRILYYKLRHYFNRNSKSGSKKNISAHYDLGNDFYSVWLDSSMTYSSAYWGENPNMSLHEAQLNKYALALNSLGAKPGDHILEIGCGWGAFAEFAAKQGYRWTGVTISQEQYNYARERIRRAGLTDQVNILLMDYRDIKGQFDHVVSIEMIEAVGQEYWQSYFSRIIEVVKPGGAVAIQAITMSDEHFDSYKKGTDFIQQYIFPGGMLLCERELRRLALSVDGQNLSFVEFGQDYAHTLKLWREAYFANLTKITALGFSEEFHRMWDFYMQDCEGAFRAEHINVVTFSFLKPSS